MPHKRAKRSIREADKAQRGFNLAPTAASRADDSPRGAARIFNAMKVQAAFRASGRTTSEDTGDKYAARMRAKAAKEREKEQKDKKDKDKASEGGSVKRKAGDDKETKTTGKDGKDDAPKAKKKKAKTELPKIGEHETLGEYNRRVEGLMRGGVASAIKAAAQVKGQQIQAAKDAKAERIAIAQGKKKPTAGSDDDAAGEPAVLKPNRPERTFAELPQRKRLNDIVQAPPQLPRMRQAKRSESGIGSASAWGATGRTPLSAAQKRILETERERVVTLYREMKAKKEAEKEKEREKPKAKK